MVISALVKSALLTGHLAIEPPKAPAVPEKTKPVAELNKPMQVAWSNGKTGAVIDRAVASHEASEYRVDRQRSQQTVDRWGRALGSAAKAYQSHQAVKKTPPVSKQIAMQRENLRAAAAAGDTDAARRLEGIREFEERRYSQPTPSAPAVADNNRALREPTLSDHDGDGVCAHLTGQDCFRAVNGLPY